MTHISTRYDTVETLEAEAREVFPNTVVAHDLMTFPVTHRDNQR